MTTQSDTIDISGVRRIVVDCHAYPWHLEDPEYPECGPDNLVRMAEEYGVLVKFLPEHDWSDWAWWYEIVGPGEHIVKLLANEYGDEWTAREMVEEGSEPWTGVWVP